MLKMNIVYRLTVRLSSGNMPTLLFVASSVIKTRSHIFHYTVILTFIKWHYLQHADVNEPRLCNLFLSLYVIMFNGSIKNMLNVIINILKLLLLITKRDLTFNKISLLNDKYPRWGSWDFFRSFKVCSNAKERVGAESNGKLLHLLNSQ